MSLAAFLVGPREGLEASLIVGILLAGLNRRGATDAKRSLWWGVALAVVADATIVRCLLVPSVLRLFGRAAWWAPAPLARVQRAFDRTLGERSTEVGHARSRV